MAEFISQLKLSDGHILDYLKMLSDYEVMISNLLLVLKREIWLDVDNIFRQIILNVFFIKESDYLFNNLVYFFKYGWNGKLTAFKCSKINEFWKKTSYLIKHLKNWEDYIL